MKRLILLLSTLFWLGCPPQPDAPSPRPDPATDSELCGAMCDHIGPKGLKCEEGEPLYDSDLPGPVGEPNETCEAFCVKQQDAGAFLNPRCVMQAPTCDTIEHFRQMDCSVKK